MNKKKNNKNKKKKKGISPNPDKVRVVKEFPTPTNLKELRSFLGLANYYRRFVRGFSNIANSLNALTKKNVPFVWTVPCAEAFDKLKRALVSAPILAYPNFREPFLLFVDATTSCKNDETLPRKNDLSYFKSLLVTGL